MSSSREGLIAYERIETSECLSKGILPTREGLIAYERIETVTPVPRRVVVLVPREGLIAYERIETHLRIVVLEMFQLARASSHTSELKHDSMKLCEIRT